MKGGEGLKINHKGFTLVELIVVVVLIGVLAAMIGASVSSVSSVRARRCAESVDMLISKCRVGAISHTGEVKLELSLDSKGNVVGSYYEGGILVSNETIPASGVSVSCTVGSSTLALGSAALLSLSFDRVTGAQRAQPDGSMCTVIRFESSRSYTIELVPSTGSHKLV